MKEREFQKKLIAELKKRFPGCIVLKNDPTYIQGVPDLTIFYKDKWATLEVKQTMNSSIQPNQVYFVKLMNEMSFSKFISPENKEEILNELQQAFQS